MGRRKNNDYMECTWYIEKRRRGEEKKNGNGSAKECVKV